MSESIAVVIPVFNASEYLARCIQSCISQEELSEILIINDGSSDNSKEIIKQYVEIDERITLLEHEFGQNLGVSASRNLAIKTAQSKWITFLDADDYFLPGRIKSFSNLKVKSSDGYYEDVQSEYEDSKLEGSISSITGITPPILPEQLFDYLLSNREESIAIMGLIVNKTLLNRVSLFDESLSIGEDTDIIWRLAYEGKLVKIQNDQPYVIRWVHSKNTYQDKSKLNEGRYIFYKMWNDRISQYRISKKGARRIKESFRFYKYDRDVRGRNFIKRILLFLKFRISKILGN